MDYRLSFHFDETTHAKTEFWTTCTKTFNSRGELHSFGDEPAISCKNGALAWHKDGLLHRDGDKPAIISAEGNQEWWKNGYRYRENGLPIVVYSDGKVVF